MAKSRNPVEFPDLNLALQPDTLEMLVHLMCAQARECLFEKAELHAAMTDKDDAAAVASAAAAATRLESHLVLGQEAAHVSEVGNAMGMHILTFFI